MFMDLYTILTIVFLSALFSVSRWVVSTRQSRRPPGPYRWPIIGNAFQMPVTHQWETFSRWAESYGKITYLEVMGQPIAVVNSVELAKKLLDKQIYSNRPRLVMAGELCRFNRYFPLAPYGEEWREQRKLISSGLGKSAVPKFYCLQEGEARKFVRTLLEKPEEFYPELKLRIGSIIMRVNYGYYPSTELDPLLVPSLRTMENFSKVTEPGAWLVDFVPCLKYLPRWVPGTGFLRAAEIFDSECEVGSWTPYLWCRENMPTGKALLPNICSNFLSAGPLSTKNEQRLVRALMSAFGGGLDTCLSLLYSFFILISLYPEVQRKAQDEIDRVVGNGRLPTINDKDNLPYLRSLITEVMRLCPSLPLALPHSLVQDDVLDDFLHLPKNTLVLANVWYMLRDPQVYPQPEQFNPDRYNLSSQEMKKVWELLFGFGRRACPGIHLAEGTMFAFISTILATCTIPPVKDSNGKTLKNEKDIRFSSGSIIFPQSFECKLEARSQQALELLDEILPAF